MTGYQGIGTLRFGIFLRRHSWSPGLKVGTTVVSWKWRLLSKPLQSHQNQQVLSISLDIFGIHKMPPLSGLICLVRCWWPSWFRLQLQLDCFEPSEAPSNPPETRNLKIIHLKFGKLSKPNLHDFGFQHVLGGVFVSYPTTRGPQSWGKPH